MDFETFCYEISDNIADYLPELDIEKVNIEKINKNNGVEYTGIVIVVKDENVAPNIYLDYYYMLYKQGKTLDEVLKLIGCEYKRARMAIVATNFNVSYEGVKENCIIKLVNYEKNKEILKNCPYEKYLDLAITFRYIVRLDEDGIASALISNKDLANWGMSKEELYHIALDNTRKKFPEKLRNINDIIPDVASFNDEDSKKMFVITNEAGINGATVVLYDDVVRKLARQQKSNLYIIPSSIHEMIAICCDAAQKEGLKELVREVNKFIVTQMEYLSDNVYFYDLETDKITI